MNCTSENLVKPMKTFHVTCQEITTFVVEVTAENESEATDKVCDNVNAFEVINESTSEWTIDEIEEV